MKPWPLAIFVLFVVPVAFAAGMLTERGIVQYKAEQEARAGVKKAKEPPWPHLTNCHLLPEIKWACSVSARMEVGRYPLYQPKPTETTKEQEHGRKAHLQHQGRGR